jgi:hypothetical protein
MAEPVGVENGHTRARERRILGEELGAALPQSSLAQSDLGQQPSSASST